MPDLSALLANKRQLSVSFDNATIQITYRPGSTSIKRQAELQAEMQEIQNREDAMGMARKTVEIFCEIVSGWDLTDNGQPIPITVDAVIGLSDEVVNTIMGAISADKQRIAEEKKLSSVRSAAGLPVGANTAIAQNGIHSSEPRGSWA